MQISAVCSDWIGYTLTYYLYNRGKDFLEVMDPKNTQEWTSCEEEEFKAHFAELWYEKSCDRMEALAKRFPAKSIQQLRDKYAEVFADMLCGETDGEPSRDDATVDWDDWCKLLEGETQDLVMDPLVETSLFEPSKQLLFGPAGDQEEIQKSHCKLSRKRKQYWTAEEHRYFQSFILFLFIYQLLVPLYFISLLICLCMLPCSLRVNSIKDVYIRDLFLF